MVRGKSGRISELRWVVDYKNKKRVPAAALFGRPRGWILLYGVVDLEECCFYEVKVMMMRNFFFLSHFLEI